MDLGKRTTIHTSIHVRRVASLISNSTAFERQRKRKEKEGRYITVKGTTAHTMVSLINVCALSDADKPHFKSLFDVIVLEIEGMCIYGGALMRF